MRRTEKLLGAWANRAKERVLRTWANRAEKPKKVNLNLALKQKYAKSAKNKIKNWEC